MVYAPVVVVLVALWWVQTAILGALSFRRRRVSKEEVAREARRASSPTRGLLCARAAPPKEGDRVLRFGPQSVVGNSRPSWICGGGLFGAVWTILYALLAVELSFLLLSRPDVTPSGIWTAAVILRFVNGFCNALWSPLAFGKFQWRVALAVIVVGLAASILSQVFVAVENEWLSFGLHMPNTVWLFVAFILNVLTIMWYERQRRDRGRALLLATD